MLSIHRNRRLKETDSWESRMSHHCMCNYFGARLVVDKVAAVTSPENATVR